VDIGESGAAGGDRRAEFTFRALDGTLVAFEVAHDVSRDLIALVVCCGGGTRRPPG
jgi:hypothetical protein